MVRGRVETAVGTMCDLCIREPDDLSHGARGFVIVICCSEVFVWNFLQIQDSWKSDFWRRKVI